MSIRNHIATLICTVLLSNAAAGRAEDDKTVTIDLGGDVKIDFVRIPAGTFMMGSAEDEADRGPDEGPQHRVTIARPFYMGKFEVTNAQFRRFDPKHKAAPYIEYEKEFSLDGDKQPAVYIHWKQTEWFCDWLSKQTKGKFRARLPSEAEWEYAARGGSDSPFLWGNNWPPKKGAGNFADVAIQKQVGKYWEIVPDYDDEFPVTAPVGNFEPNSFGLYDMAGNVWEWCLDGWHADYKGAPTDGSAQDTALVAAKAKYISVRGGAWHNFRRTALRSAYRGNIRFTYNATTKHSPTRYPHLGFRVVLTAELNNSG